MANEQKYSGPIVVGSLSADPGTAYNGQIYYNTTSNTFRMFQNGGWTPIATGSVSLTGQTLNNENIIVGNGSNLSAAVDTSSVGNILADPSTGLTIKNGVITNSMVSGSAAIAYSKLNLLASIVNADISATAAIAYTKLSLANSIVNADISSSAAIAYSKLNLSNSIVNADINASAAIAYSKLNLALAITNSDIATSAAIALNKLAALNNNIVPVTNSSGFLASSIVTATELSYLSGVTSAIQTQLNGKASTALDNLASTQINADLIPDTDDTYALGSGTKQWNIVYTPSIQNTGVDAGNLDLTLSSSLGKIVLSGSEVDFGGVKGTNAADPTSPQDLVTKFYADNIKAGISWKTEGRAASVANVNVASAPSSIDGVSLISGDRVLLKNQTAPAENGIYDFHSAGNPLTRSPDASSWVAIVGAALLITEGSTNAGTVYLNNNIAGGTINVTGISFIALNIAGTVTGSGTAGYVTYWNGTANLTAEQFLSTVRGGTGGDSSGSTGIAHVSSGTWSYSQIVNTDVSASAAIAYSKLNLAASIVNADIASAAAIARNKLAALTANRVLLSDSSGFDTDTNSNSPSLLVNLLKFGPSSGQTIEDQYIHSTTLTNNQSSPVAVSAATTFDWSTYMGIRVDYVLKDGSSPTKTRMGFIKIIANSDGSLSSAPDEYTDTADTGVVFSAATNGTDIELRYTTTNTSARTMRMRVQRYLI